MGIGRKVRVRREIEEIIGVLSKILDTPAPRLRNYLILLGVLELLKYADNPIVRPRIDWDEIRRLEREIRKTLENLEKTPKKKVEA